MQPEEEWQEGTCRVCAAEWRNSYSEPYKSRMVKDSMCFRCVLWDMRAAKGARTVIDGAVYTPGRRTTGEFRGMGGRRFDIEYYDGRRITTFDLWYGGIVPPEWRSKFPDTARFIGDAERALVGEITCFNPSRSQEPAYPLPEVDDAA